MARLHKFRSAARDVTSKEARLHTSRSAAWDETGGEAMLHDFRIVAWDDTSKEARLHKFRIGTRDETGEDLAFSTAALRLRNQSKVRETLLPIESGPKMFYGHFELESCKTQ